MGPVPTEVTTDEGVRRAVYVAIELSKKGWLVAVRGPVGDRISLHRFAAGDAAGLLALVSRARGAAAEALGAGVPVLACHEIGYDGFWLHRVLTTAGVVNHVVDPASVHVDRRARRAKTDRIDVQALLRSLMAYHRGEGRVWSVVRVPTPEEEDARRPHRERQNLIKERGRHVNRIKGLCAQQGILDYEPMRADRHERLAELRTGDGRPLPQGLLAEIRREIARLELLVEQIGELETQREAALKVGRTGEAAAARRVLGLRRLLAVGPETSAVLANEVFFRRFDGRRQLAAYVGLAPTPHMSGGLSREQGIAKSGNPRARTALVELAWLWLRHQPRSALSQWFARRVGDQRGRLRRIMVVALARKLLVALWRFLETGLVPQGAALRA
ncbi:MAG TPA: IS110 family transposase [Geminicoccaceae bacterium]|nr:IS110 family transposase [Geminicoccaceae bacterium]